MLNAQTDDDLSLAVGVARVDHGIHVGTVAQRADGFKLLDYTAVKLLIASLAQLKMELSGKARQVVHAPASVGRGIIIFHVGKREQMTERPGNEIAVALQIPVAARHACVARYLLNGSGNISAKAWLFGKN